MKGGAEMKRLQKIKSSRIYLFILFMGCLIIGATLLLLSIIFFVMVLLKFTTPNRVVNTIIVVAAALVATAIFLIGMLLIDYAMTYLKDRLERNR